MPKQGEFVWHDLATPDLKGAAAFYGEVVGWKAEQMPGVDMEYLALNHGDVTVGGAMLLTDEMKQMGAPPSWTPCIATEDIDALCVRATELGGTVMQQPSDVPGGRFALLADPQGAVFEVYQSQTANGEAEQLADVPPGRFSWYDLNTTDWEAARAFYTELFAWSESAVMGDSPAGTYWMFKSVSGDRAVGGMSNMAAMTQLPPHWMCYVTVDDLDAALERVKAHGGQVTNGPMQVPGGDRIAHCMDAQGAAIALHASA
jgi:predicted enzyme related to lactoylglutathione lyase